MVKFVDNLSIYADNVALIFGGQGSPWRHIVNDLAVGSFGQEYQKIQSDVQRKLEPIRDQLIIIQPEIDRVKDSDALVSLPGILSAQYLTLKSIINFGLKVDNISPHLVDGHSQGILAKELVEAVRNNDYQKLVQIFVIANLIAYSATKVAQNKNIFCEKDATPMLSVRGATRSIIEDVISKFEKTNSFKAQVSIAVKNDDNHFIVSGYPNDLNSLIQGLEIASQKSKMLLEQKEIGGAPLEIVAEFLDVTLPFHSPLLSQAIQYVFEWATKIGIDVSLASQMAMDVLVHRVDWAKSVNDILDHGVKYLVDLGPSTVVGKMTERLIQGTGSAIVYASDAQSLQNLSHVDYQPSVSSSWLKFAPKLVELPNGKKVVDTAFTRLTGKSPILLAGMTPTTVEPEIVAAAANAGYWSELAGGGQVTAEVFNENLAGLQAQLKPGQTAQFNSMFLDRYLWNLQFGGTKIVSRARAAGAPIDGVVITAGIPEYDEAVELVRTLNNEGFPFVTFKPGTVAQINQVLKIAQAVPEFKVIMQVEDGHAGGHHSWEHLDDLLLTTYAQIREVDNVILCAGGGIGKPQKAVDYITGIWSQKYSKPKMPVDGVLVGTAAMTVKEAHTTASVKQLLVETQGISEDDVTSDLSHAHTWVGSGASKGGMTSGLSHLRADIYEIDNDSAACARLISEIGSDEQKIESHKEQIIEALNKTAKPYFGNIETMTYFEMASRFASLCFNEGQKLGDKVEDSWVDRFYDILQRVEARMNSKESGEIESLFANVDDVVDFKSALQKLVEVYPNAVETKVKATDAAWFIECCRKHPKPVPFVPRLDTELFKWWGSDSLWQSHDNRYAASSCRIIPGPVSVAGIDRVDEPVADLLGRFESAVVDNLQNNNAESKKVVSRLNNAQTILDYIKSSKHISWTNHLINNPANFLDESQYSLNFIAESDANALFDLVIKLDTYWDNDQNSDAFHVVRHLTIPLKVSYECAFGIAPLVDEDRLPESMYSMLSTTAGVGGLSPVGEMIDKMPSMEKIDANVIGNVKFSSPSFGRAKYSFTVGDNLGSDHANVTGGAIDSANFEGFERADIVPDAVLGMCWPSIYAALGSATITLGDKTDYPVIEGLLNAVHLDHSVDQITPLDKLKGKRLNTYAWAEDLQESVSGRIVDVRVVATIDGSGDSPENEQIAVRFRERFAIQGRASGTNIPKSPDEAGGKLSLVNHPEMIIPTKRRLLRAVRVKAPSDMTPFARVSGDYNPIHTSTNAAKVAGLKGPIVHGMWLSAVAQHLVSARFGKDNGYEISGWTVQWYAPTNLNDTVELTLERTGKIRGGGILLEVIAKINGELTAKFTAATTAPVTAYCYPGQGIQHQGMVLDERSLSKAADAVWRKADQHTRTKLGFSIVSVVRDNPTDLYANGTHYYHPDGVLNLTQFTQVALTVVGFAQMSRLREDGAVVENGYFAGHSLGEYVALSSYANIIPLTTVIELVFARGSAMHSLVERDANGRSNYLMGALRPNQFGVGDKDVKAYVKQVADKCGEFLEIVNYNLAGQQYAVAGTIAGLKALKADSSKRVAEYGGKGAFMYVPGIDVPFHSSKLHPGVPEFREKLMSLLPQEIDYDSLVGRYIPNLVARPFEWTIEFAKLILDVVPSKAIEEVTSSQQVWDKALEDKNKLGRLLIVELLCWQFASPVRWIETQELLFSAQNNGGLGIDNFVEVGLKNAPTLANLATKTLSLPQFGDADVQVFNLQRDEARLYFNDDDSAVDMDAFAEEGLKLAAVEDNKGSEQSEAPQANVDEAVVVSASVNNEASAEPAAVAQVAQTASSSAPAQDLTFKASDAISALFAYANKLLPEQIGANDNAETLTNGVSSRRNQLLMDMSSELGLASIDSAAEAPVSQLLLTVDKMAHNYKPFGPVLGEIIRSHVRKLFGSSGVKQSQIASRVAMAWGLNDGWADFVTIEIVLGTRDGQSMRGGELSTLGSDALSNANAVDALIDKAVQSVAAKFGVSVAQQGSSSSSGGGVVDSAALDEFSAKVIGKDGVLASTAREVLKQLGLDEPVVAIDASEIEENKAIVDAVTAELGQDWPKRVKPNFDPQKVVLFDDRWALAKEDLAQLYVQGESSGIQNHHFIDAGQIVADQANYYAHKCVSDNNTSLAQIFESIASDCVSQDKSKALEFKDDIAVVTGAAPKSIAGGVVAKLLSGGATVIITASNINAKRLDYAKDLYRKNATGDAQLYLVQANLTSYRDVDAFVTWVGDELKESVGGKTKIIKPALKPTLLFPFAAPSVKGTLADAGSEAEMETRLLLWSVERIIAGLSQIGTNTDIAHKLHVVLPGSPNRGIFGGDGAYGEVKAAFDAIEKRWNVEKRWAQYVTIAHPKIGWVRGTSLMGGNDPLVEAVEKVGVHTYSTEEMADELLALCSVESRKQAQIAPLDKDLTGGLGGTTLDLAALKSQAIAKMKADALLLEESALNNSNSKERQTQKLKALPNVLSISQPAFNKNNWLNVSTKLEDMTVIVGVGEVGPWGSGRTRFEAEHGINSDGTVDLTPAGVLELAWMMNLIQWSDNPKSGWYDENQNLIPEEEIFERFRDEVVARSGVREYVNDDLAWINELGTEQDVTVYLDKDVTFSVDTYELAQSYAQIDPDHTIIVENTESGEWDVTKKAGSKARVPRKAAMTRKVGGQIPTNFDPAKWGIPASMIESADRLAIWNLVSTVDAFISAGFSPDELLKAVHPSDVGLTQGTGIGGTDSMRKLFVDGFLGEDRPTDILQEALPNVIAAHVMQSYVGGYGVMVHPVGACATAAVSIEDAVDKIKCGKADFVVAGAIDDISIESITGFGDMNATAKTDDLRAKGIQDRFVSRANDRRRGGFVESEGGGTVLVTRGDIALKLGLPVFGVIGYARSFADGAHTSIPAPGLGALASVRSGKDSVFVKQLAGLGVNPDDISVISKHDTSTNANDPNESELYTRISDAIGRKKGNPLYVISQKTVTGHAKGGAAVFQVHGLCQLFRTGKIPANKALDCVGPEFKTHGPITWLRQPLDLSSKSDIKAGLVTSLGFGHVSALLAIVNPGAFEAAIINEFGADNASHWKESANMRLAKGLQKIEDAMLQRSPLFEPISSRRFKDKTKGYDPHEIEADLLLNPDYRLGDDGTY